MKMASLLLFASLLASSLQDPVTVSVYYEALCPDSVDFVVRQLFPTWKRLGGAVFAVDFVPYGKANHTMQPDGQWAFRCQHGPQECQANMMQACALSLLEGRPDLQMEFVYCVMENGTTSAKQCADSLEIDFRPILDCSQSRYGQVLLASLGYRTHAIMPKIGFVPSVLFNGTFTEANQNLALRDLGKVISQFLPAEGTGNGAAGLRLIGGPLLFAILVVVHLRWW